MKFLRYFLYFLLALIALIILFVIGFNLYYSISNRNTKSVLVEKPVIENQGHRYRDLNHNGRVDIYEDPGQPVEARIADLLSQMNLEEKVGLMWHPPIGVGKHGEVLGRPSMFSFASSYDLLINRKIRHFNVFQIPGPEAMATWYNAVQKIAEQDRLGIPVTISSDPRHGINNFLATDMLNSDFSKWPEPLGLAAIGDSILTYNFGHIANQEYRAVGIRCALHPMADLATEPRWARINGTFGEDASLAAKMTAAYIYGFQGKKLDSASVACMTKHFPGGGPQADGEDAHFSYGKEQVYPGNNFRYHLIPFKAAFEAGTAMIMPYYGIPVGQTDEDVGMSYNTEIITGLLRDEMGFDGVVCTDWAIVEGFSFLGFEIFEGKYWGVEDLSIKQRIKKAIDAGVDQFGGNMNTDELLDLVRDGEISEERIDQSVKRLLKVKFLLGLFDDPYVDVEKTGHIVGKKEFVDKGKEAQRKSIVLLKNGIRADSSLYLPLDNDIKLYVENIDKEIAGKYGTVVDSLDEADMAILRLRTPYEPRHNDFVEAMFHQGDLDYKDPEKSRILSILNRKPSIVCIYLDRPAVIPEITAASVGLVADFGASDEAILDIVFGKYHPEGKLPIELPSSMEAVRNQDEDVPYDSGNPLFPFGFGLTY